MDKIRTPLSNIMKIMNLVLKRIEKKGLAESKTMPMIKGLIKKGFRIEDIDTAMGLISMMTAQVDPIIHVSERETRDGRNTGVRHLNELEAIRLTPDAQKLLLGLVDNQVITPLHFERTMDYIFKKDLRHVGVTRLELLIALSRPESELEDILVEPMPQSLSVH